MKITIPLAAALTLPDAFLVDYVRVYDLVEKK
jgi:hypothetical protein